jgi:hypothetical protein
VQIHEVESDATLEITLDPVDRHLLPHIQYPAEADPRFRDGLVHALILSNPLAEVGLGLFARHPSVVWVARRCLESNICGDDGGVIAE